MNTKIFFSTFFCFAIAGQILFSQQSPKEQWIAPPENMEIEVRRESIKIIWESPSSKPGRETTEITGYHLVKEWFEGRAKRSKLYVIGTETSFSDSEAETDVDYSYKVRAYTLNTQAKGGHLIDFTAKGQEVSKKMVVSDYSKSQRGKIYSLYRMKLLGVTTSGDAFVELSKWKSGNWRKAKFVVKKGEKIEKKVYIKELSKEIHFNPGWTLIAMTTRAKRYKMIQQTVPEMEDGKKVLKKKQIKKAYYASAIRYKDKRGKTYSLYQK